MTAGSWSILGYKLPEFGLTERAARTVSGGRTTDLSNAITRNYAQAAPQPQVKGESTAFIGPQLPYGPQPVRPNNITSNNQTNQNFNQGVSNIQNQGDQGLDFIDQDYNNAIGMLSAQEGSLRGQADVATGEITSGVGATGTELRNAQAKQEGNIQGQVQTAESGAQSATQQARDLFRQTQQSNIAQLSALGISSSSVSEALAERLGVETARRIGGITGSLDEVRQNATQELTRTKEYYQGKLNDLSSWANTEKAKIQQSLISGLNQINGAKQQAATDKARGRAELINNVQNQIFQLQQEEQKFKQSLEQWAAQKTQALTPIVTDPKFLETLQSTTNTLNQGFAPTGFNYAPEFSTDPYGNVKGQVSYGLNKKPEEDDLAAKYGITQP